MTVSSPRRTPLARWARLTFAAAAVALPTGWLMAEGNWPQWRGPNATGAVTEATPPTEWSESKNVKWKVALPGSGSSTPIIWGDKMFIHAAIPAGKSPGEAGEAPAAQAQPDAQPQPPRGPDGGPGGPGGPGGRPRRPGGFGGRPGGGFGGGDKPTTAYKFDVLCLDRNSGKTLWQKTVKEVVPHEGHHRDHGFASHSPVTDGKLLISFFGSRGLHCLDLDGNIKWSKDLGKMQTRNSFGEGGAPALHGNTVVVQWDHEGEDDFIAAFDTQTGKELWRNKRNEATGWSTPVIVEHGGKAQVIASNTNAVRAYDLETGKEIWNVGPLTTNVIPAPVWDGKDMVYVMSGFRGAQLYAIRLGKTGNLAGTDAIVWEHKKSTPYVPSPLLYQDRLYFFSGNNAILSVFDAKTGKPLIDTQRLEEMQNVYSSPVGAGGHVYLTGRNGVTQVIKASDKLEVVATNHLDERIDASPAVVGKQIFLRGEKSLYCIE